MLDLRRTLAGVALAGLLASTALAEVTPTEGTIGTEFTATFSAAPASNARIELRFVEPGAKGSKAKAKVVAVDGADVTFVIQAANGGGDFEVGIKGGDDTAGTIRLQPPQVDSAESATVAAGGNLVLNGAFFGEDSNNRNAPKVFVNGKKAKTLVFSDARLEIQLHRSTPTGTADITVQNKIGASTLLGQLTVTPAPKPIKGGDKLAVRIDGKNFSAKRTKKAPEAAVAVFNIGNNSLQITVAKASGNPRKRVRTQNLNLNALLGDTLENLTYPVTFGPIDLGTYLDSTTTLGGGFPPTPVITTGTWTSAAGGAITLTLDAYDGERISGSFSGSLDLAAGEGPATVTFTNGSFVLTVQQ